MRFDGAEEVASDAFLCGEFEMGLVVGDAGDAGVGVDVEFELFDDGAEIGEVFFARGFFLKWCGERDAGDGDAFVGAEPACAGGPPLHCGADLSGFEMLIGEAGAFKCGGHFDTEGACADEGDGMVGCLHTGIKPSSWSLTKDARAESLRGGGWRLLLEASYLRSD